MVIEIRLEVALGKNKGCEMQTGKKLSGMIEMLFILTRVVISGIFICQNHPHKICAFDCM